MAVETVSKGVETAETVLLVIDAENVRTVASSTLRKAGYRVMAVSQEDASRGLFRDNSAGIKLAVVDEGSDREAALEFVRKLQEQVPELRVLLLSNEMESDSFGDCRSQPFCWVMRKPYRRAQLLGHVLSAMADPLTSVAN